MKIHSNYNLKHLNTLSVDCRCDRFVEIDSLASLEALPKDVKITEMLVLGGGSNLLLSQDLHRFVARIKPRKHITIVDNLVVAWAGTVWNDLVDWAVDRNLGGIENLAGIPGLVGGAPFQNIGAYGTEIKDSLVWVEVYNWQTGVYHRLSNEECMFSYRHSIFKYHDQPWIISRIGLDLRPDSPKNLSYGELKDAFTEQESPSYRQIADAVRNIRSAKLPDPEKLPNAGSFFKNPIVSAQQVKRIQRRFKDMPSYVTDNPDEFKTSAAWLLEQCGFKGHKEGDAGFSSKHALILVNHGKATGQDLLRMTKLAKRAVKNKFSIELEEEVRVL